MPPRRKTAVVLLGNAVITTAAGNSHYAILSSQENGRGLSATMQSAHNTCNIVKKNFLGEHSLSPFLVLSFIYLFLLEAHHPLSPTDVFTFIAIILRFFGFSCACGEMPMLFHVQ